MYYTDTVFPSERMKTRFTEDSYRKEPTMQSLVHAMQACNTDDELLNFLRDVATLPELQAWSERLEVARLLAQGLSYRQVAAKTGASTTTVTRVAQTLENGTGGYRKLLNTHRHHSVRKQQAQKAKEAQGRPGSAPSSPLEKYLRRASHQEN